MHGTKIKKILMNNLDILQNLYIWNNGLQHSAVSAKRNTILFPLVSSNLS